MRWITTHQCFQIHQRLLAQISNSIGQLSANGDSRGNGTLALR